MKKPIEASGGGYSEWVVGRGAAEAKSLSFVENDEDYEGRAAQYAKTHI